MKIRLYLLFLSIFLTGCGVTVRSYQQSSLSDVKIRVEVYNKTYDAGVTYIFKDACEASLVKKGATVVSVDENYYIELVIKEVKTTPVSFSVTDIATNYNLNVKGSFKVFKIDGKSRKKVIENDFSSLQSFSVTNPDMTETKRQLSIMQAAYEISEGIKDRLTMLQ